MEFDNKSGKGWLSKRLEELKASRQPHEAMWKDIQQYILPHVGNLDNQRKSNPKPDYSQIYNTQAIHSVQDFVALLMGGMSSPARPWFRFSLNEIGREISHESRAWMDYYRDLMLEVFARSNFYEILPLVYEEGAGFGNGFMYLAEDRKDIIRAHHYTIGEFFWGKNERLERDTVYRPFTMKVRHLVNKFGLENCSKQVQVHYKANKLDQDIQVCHAIEPVTNALPDSLKPPNRAHKYLSVYYETAKQADENKFLSVSGFREFPGMAFALGSRSEDPWAVGIGQNALPDVKQLQSEQFGLSEAIDYARLPMMQSKGNIGEVFVHPGSIVKVNPTGIDDGLTPVFGVKPDIQGTLLLIQTFEQRIKRWFHNDLARNVLDENRSQVTAREIDAGEQEKLLLLGPLIDSVQNFLAPSISRTFEVMLTNGVGELPPEELQGADLGVEFLGIMAQAQKAVGTRAIERTWQFAAGIAEMKQDPSVLDNLDPDEAVRDYARLVGSPTDQLVDEKRVEAIREQRAIDAQQAQQMAMAEQMAGTAKTMSDTSLDDGSALRQALDTVGAGI